VGQYVPIKQKFEMERTNGSFLYAPPIFFPILSFIFPSSPSPPLPFLFSSLLFSSLHPFLLFPSPLSLHFNALPSSPLLPFMFSFPHLSSLPNGPISCPFSSMEGVGVGMAILPVLQRLGVAAYGVKSVKLLASKLNGLIIIVTEPIYNVSTG